MYQQTLTCAQFSTQCLQHSTPSRKLCHVLLKECKIYLCGTKRDLLENKERPIDYHDTTDYADTINAKLFETSSKTGENIGKH